MAHLNYAYADKLFVRYQLADNPEADTILIFGGWPGDYANKNTIEFLREQGYHVFSALYPGIYQSHGTFLATNPVQEYQQLLQTIQEGTIDNLYTKQKETFTTKKIIFLGSSFGGSIALGAASTYNPDRLLLFAPVWDWSKQDDLENEVAFAKQAFQHVYRLGFSDAQEMQEQLESFKQLQPKHYTNTITCPVLVLHDPEDKIVPYEHTKTQDLECEVIEHAFGHGQSEPLIAHWTQIQQFLE